MKSFKRNTFRTLILLTMIDTPLAFRSLAQAQMASNFHFCDKNLEQGGHRQHERCSYTF